jgi:YidC/Oxa1 family membrane protein insertase
MEERRLLLAVALSLLVLTAYQMLFPPPRPSASPRPSVATAPASPGAAALEAAPAPESPAEARRPTLADERERRVEVEGPQLAAAFTNRGARLLSWRLLHHRDAQGRAEEMVQTSASGPRPLDLETGDAALDGTLRSALFVASPETLSLTPTGERGLTFRYAEGRLLVEKRLEFDPTSYQVRVFARVVRDERELPVRVVWGPGIGNPSAAEMEVRGYLAPHGVALVARAVERHPVEKLTAPLALPEARWLGVESHYFAALWVPAAGRGGELRAVALPPREDGTARSAAAAVVALGPDPALLYVGPKDYQVLRGIGHDLAEVVPVGDWIGPIVVPLLGVLRFVHKYIGNYGWSIVVLTVLINLALAPLRHYSIANGFKMAKLAPEMRVIQDRYRKVPALDPRRQEMQQEIAALYARHGMSMGTQMAVGCLPILLTMPFLFAFYRVLDVSIDLRGAPFLWISDLSAKDPLFITPVLMGVSMFVMQKLTPSTMDPAQQRIMLLMPVVMAGMFFWAPGGLNLYWLVSNLCSIAQQGLTLRLLREAAPARERRRR